MAPAAVVGARHGLVEAVVDQPEPGAAVVGRVQVDLDGGRAGWDADLRAFPAVAEHDPPVGYELDERAAAGVTVGVRPADDAARAWVEDGFVGHPPDELRRVGHQPIHHAWAGGDGQLLHDEPHDAPRLSASARLSAAACSRCRGAAQKASRNEASCAIWATSAR